MLRRTRLDSTQLTFAARLIREAQRVVVLTGAGISTPSGIPDFRSVSTGLWSMVDPMEVASIWGFRSHPHRFYEWLRPLVQQMLRASPNAAHRALAQLEQIGRLHVVVTQNIDNLHQVAGSNRVIELHGHLRTMTCLNCGHRHTTPPYLKAYLDHGMLPACTVCGSALKPDVILFGEPLPEDAILKAQEEALHSDLMIVVGSSLEVMPAADLPALAVRSGSRLILINLAPTLSDHLADVVIRGNVAEVLPKLLALVQQA